MIDPKLEKLIKETAFETGIAEGRIKRAFLDAMAFARDTIEKGECRRIRLFKLGTLVPFSVNLEKQLRLAGRTENLPSIDDILDTHKNKYKDGISGSGK